MYGKGKGISSSAVPYRRRAPTWVKMKTEDVCDHICKLAKKGLTPSQIGVTLRDSFGIPQAGHFSPVGGYHVESDSVLILDVARFKYPPHWAPLQDVAEAMANVDPDTGMPRGFMHLRLQQEENAGNRRFQPLYLASMPASAGRRLSEALSAQLATQCRAYAGSWESWPTVAVRRWLQAASVAEPQVLRRLLQVGDVAALHEVLHRLDGLPIYRELCRAYDDVVIGSGASARGAMADFPPLRFKGGTADGAAEQFVAASEDLGLETCGELWVVLLLFLPDHLRANVAVELAELQMAQDIACTVRGPWALPLEALREALSLLLASLDARVCMATARLDMKALHKQ